jgi:hypothetical protein
MDVWTYIYVYWIGRGNMALSLDDGNISLGLLGTSYLLEAIKSQDIAIGNAPT